MRADGADAVTVNYVAWGQTQLTDSLGNNTTYGSQYVGGQMMINSITGPGCASCGGRGNATFVYNSTGTRSSSTDALGRQTCYTYDALGNLSTLVLITPKGGGGDDNPDLGTGGGCSTNGLKWTYTYNSLQEVLTAMDPAGNITSNFYDGFGNLDQTTTPPPSGSGSGLTTNFQYDNMGEVTQVTDPNGNSTYISYTPAGLIANIQDAQGNVTAFTYDPRGNRLTSTDALLQKTNYTYDVMNRLTLITAPDGSTTGFGYDYRGRRTSVTDANGKTTGYQYDDADRLTAVTDAALNMTGYSYDTENNLRSITDALTRGTAFAYTNMGKVMQVTSPRTSPRVTFMMP